jgi:transcriptional regulator with XRE-family HTH domain
VNRPAERDRVVVVLVARRRALGLTQATVGRAMGTTQSAVSELESGADCRLSTLRRYAAALGATLTVAEPDDVR